MISPTISPAHLVSLSTQSSASLSSSSTSSPFTGSSTPSTSSSTPSPAHVSEIARKAILPTSPTQTSSSVILLGESEALRKWRMEVLKMQLDISFRLGKYKEVRITAESILKIQPYNRVAIAYMKAIRKEQIKAFKKHLKDSFNSEHYDEAARIARILLEINPRDKYAQRYLNAIR